MKIFSQLAGSGLSFINQFSQCIADGPAANGHQNSESIEFSKASHRSLLDQDLAALLQGPCTFWTWPFIGYLDVACPDADRFGSLDLCANSHSTMPVDLQHECCCVRD